MLKRTGWIFVSTIAGSLLAMTCLAAGPYTATVQSVTSAPAGSAPATSVSVPAGVKLVGGGARTNYGGFGSLLTQSYPTPVFPSPPTTWTAVAKDHLSPDPATVTAYAIGINDPGDDWEVQAFSSAPSPVASHPITTAILPSGQSWVLAGGGCVDNWAPSGTYGNLLTASFPSSMTSWECRGKDHSVASPASITAFVVGIRPKRAGIPLPTVQITTATSAVADLPEIVAPAVPGAIVTGGGALAAPTDPNGAGQLLTGTYPELNAAGAVVGWHAKAKDHAVASLGTVTAFAVNLIFLPTPTGTAPPPPVVTGLSKPNGQPLDPITIFGAGFGETAGSIAFQVNPKTSAGATTILAWHDTRIDLLVPEQYGIANSYAGFLTVRRPADGATSVPYSFEFDPAYDLEELPMPPLPNMAGDQDFQFGWKDTGYSTYWQVSQVTAPPAGLFGAGGTDEFYISRRLANNWIVFDAQVIVRPERLCAVSFGPVVWDTTDPVAGAYIIGSMIGTNVPDLKVRYWAQPSCKAWYSPHIWIRGPKGVPY